MLPKARSRTARGWTLPVSLAAMLTLAALPATNDRAEARDDDRSYRLATGNATSHSYKVGIGITSLVKIEVMPTTGVDIEAFATSGLLESFLYLQQNKAQFALLSSDWDELITSEANAAFGSQLHAVATLWNEDDRSAQLVARQDVDPDAVYQITKAIFERLDFLSNVDGVIAEASLDTALDGITLPLHDGARRYYEEKAVAVPADDGSFPQIDRAGVDEAAEIDEAAAVDAAATPSGQSEPAALTPRASLPDEPAGVARTFTVYFDFDDSTINGEAEAVLDEIERFANEMQDATIWVAGYTDTSGDADYNLQLAQRRADAVMSALQSRQVGGREIDVTALGERSPWVVTADQTYESRNRRVEILIEPFRDPLARVQAGDAARGEDDATGEERSGPVF